MQPRLDILSAADLEESVELIRLAMNEDEAVWARKTMDYHFECQRHGVDSHRECFAFRDGRRMIGLVGLHHYAWGPEQHVWLSWFAVHPRYQGQGIGKLLLREIEDLARAVGYRKMLIETYSQPTFERARGFYETQGYVELGQIANYLPDGSAMVVYGKQLPARAENQAD